LSPEVVSIRTQGGWYQKTDCRAVDLWSAGVLLYKLLNGALPWTTNVQGRMDQEILLAAYNSVKSGADVTEECQNFLQGLLIEPGRRMKASEALHHDWIAVVRNDLEIPGSAHESTHNMQDKRSTTQGDEL
jgi:serine/threonine protein kinase